MAEHLNWCYNIWPRPAASRETPAQFQSALTRAEVWEAHGYDPEAEVYESLAFELLYIWDRILEAPDDYVMTCVESRVLSYFHQWIVHTQNTTVGRIAVADSRRYHYACSDHLHLLNESEPRLSEGVAQWGISQT
jgi:hypothetical protein